MFTDNVTRSTQDAADIVLVIDDSGSMNREHEWLLVMVPSLEQILIDAGKPFASVGKGGKGGEGEGIERKMLERTLLSSLFLTHMRVVCHVHT